MSAFRPASNDAFVRIMGPVAREVLGEPNKALSSGGELRWGSHGSFSVDLEKGTWCDHEDGDAGGGVLDLLRVRKGLEKPEALQWLRDRGHLPDHDRGEGTSRVIATYDYTDIQGAPLFQVVRYDPKDFRQRRPDGSGGWIWNKQGIQPVLFRLRRVSSAVRDGRTVYIAEGEKGVLALEAFGAAATCSPGGAGKWKRVRDVSVLRDADVVVLPDNDEPGRKHADQVARHLAGIARRVSVVALPKLAKGEDVADWIAAGGTAAELEAFAKNAPAWDAPQAQDVAGFDLTEDGIARAFAHKHGAELRFDHHAGSWYRWTGQVWQREETKLAFTWARQICRDLAREQHAEDRAKCMLAKAATAAAVERFAQADRAFAVTSAIWDRDPFLLGTPGGTVDLRTGVLSSARPEDFITKATAVAPSDTPECPRWLRFLNDATAGDAALIRFLQQWCGYMLTGDTREHALLFIFGPGGNGKSVFLNVVSGIFGSYGRHAAMETFTAAVGDRHPTELAMLKGARMVCASETEEGRAWAEVRIKQLTGGDTISARFMRRDFFEFRPELKLVVIGNHKPILKNIDEAARRRFNVVPFLHRPPSPDQGLESALREEWPAILRWMIDGCLDWQRHGLVRPKVVLDTTAEYFNDQDTLKQWIEECCETSKNPPYFADTNGNLFGNWKAFALQRGEDPGSSKRFNTAMGSQEFVSIKDSNGIRGRGFRGLRVRVEQPYYRPGGE